MKYFAGIETGGTKCTLAIGDEKGTIIKKVIIPTITPEQTMPEIFKFFTHEKAKHSLEAIGIGCFGPLDLHLHSPTYGSITTTPKKAWQNFNIVESIKSNLPIPVGFDTDVNAAALGEYKWGAAEGIDSFIYITVGTGIGVGAMVNNTLLHGLIHPEMGHIIVPKRDDDPFKSICPFHKSCVEGLASGPAMTQRWNVKEATDLNDDHKAWDLESYYLATAIANWTLTLSCKKVIIGGGVMNNKSILQKIKTHFQKILNGYVKHPLLGSEIDNFIVLPKHMGLSGVMGAIALAINAKED
jgi:fructokinase